MGDFLKLLYPFLYLPNVYIHTYTHVYIHICIYIHACIYTHVYIHTEMYVHTYIDVLLFSFKKKGIFKRITPIVIFDLRIPSSLSIHVRSCLLEVIQNAAYKTVQ